MGSIFSQQGAERYQQERKCWSCGAVASLAYAHLPWVELLSRAKSDPRLAAEITQAKERLAKCGAPVTESFENEELEENAKTYVLVQRSMLFVPQAEVEKEHGIKVPGEFLEEITDENGKNRRASSLATLAAEEQKKRGQCWKQPLDEAGAEAAGGAMQRHGKGRGFPKSSGERCSIGTGESGS